MTRLFLPPWNQLGWVTAPTRWNILSRWTWASLPQKRVPLNLNRVFSKIDNQCNNFSKSLGQVIELTILLQQSLTTWSNSLKSQSDSKCGLGNLSLQNNVLKKTVKTNFEVKKTIPWYPLCFAMTHWSQPKPKHLPHWDPRHSHLNLPPDQNVMSFRFFSIQTTPTPQGWNPSKSLQQDSPQIQLIHSTLKGKVSWLAFKWR